MVPLYYAAKNGHLEAVKLIVEKGLELWDKSWFSYPNWCEMAIFGGDVKVRGQAKALVLAQSGSHSTVIQYLKKQCKEYREYLSMQALEVCGIKSNSNIAPFFPVGPHTEYFHTTSTSRLHNLDNKLQKIEYYGSDYKKAGDSVIEINTSKEELIAENLFNAIKNNDRKWLTDHESDLNITGKDGEKLLHIAALKEYLDVIKYLASNILIFMLRTMLI